MLGHLFFLPLVAVETFWVGRLPSASSQTLPSTTWTPPCQDYSHYPHLVVSAYYYASFLPGWVPSHACNPPTFPKAFPRTVSVVLGPPQHCPQHPTPFGEGIAQLGITPPHPHPHHSLVRSHPPPPPPPAYLQTGRWGGKQMEL